MPVADFGAGHREPASSLLRGAPAKLMPLGVAARRAWAAHVLEGVYEERHAMAGPTRRNEVDVAVGFRVGAVRTMCCEAGRTGFLVQIADF